MSNFSGRKTELKTELNFPFGEEWLSDLLAADQSPGNVKRKRIALEQFDRFLIDYYGVSDDDILNRDKFEDFYSDLYPHMELPENCAHELMRRFSIWLADEEGLAHSSVQGRWYDVRTYLNKYIVKTTNFDTEGIGYIKKDNPKFEDNYILEWLDAGSETRKQLEDEAYNWLELEEIIKLVNGAKNFKNEMVIRCLWEFGCRPRELANIKLNQHNPDTRSFYIRTLKIDDSDHPLYRRHVYYSREMREYMRDWLDRGGREAYAYGDKDDNGEWKSGYLIVGYNTPKIGGLQVNEIVKMAAEKAGIQDDGVKRSDGYHVNRVTARTLRHSFAVHSVRGVERTGTPPMDIERLRRILGHRSLESTKSYLQFRDIELRDAFDRCHPTIP